MTQRRIMEKTGISSVEDLMYADLRHVGWDKGDAFYAAYRHLYSKYKMPEQRKIMAAIEADPAVKKRIEGERETEKRLTGEQLAVETSKEKIISDLIIARKAMKPGTKEWGEYTKMIADYSKIKQDDIKTDEQPIRYYLPALYPTSCKDCLLKKKK